MGDDVMALIFKELGVECTVEDELGDKRRVVVEHVEEAHRVRSWLISQGYPVGGVELYGVINPKYSVVMDSL